MKRRTLSVDAGVVTPEQLPNHQDCTFIKTQNGITQQVVLKEVRRRCVLVQIEDRQDRQKISQAEFCQKYRLVS